jgi:shikimate dehydrogenase
MTTSAPAACIMGWPVAHSRSPPIHGYWLRHYGIAGAYRREAVRPEDFPAFLATLAERGYVGGNVTMPLKELALELSEPDARARAVGAANTLWLENGRLRSTNTDVAGFIASLDQAAPGWDADLEKAVVIGAGGAARAAVHGLIERRVPAIHVVNRTLAKAEALRLHFGQRVRPATLEGLPEALDGAGLIANASALGMEGHPDPVWDLAPMRPDAVVAEAVYLPLETSLLRAARARGLRAADGLGMLLHQAVGGFERWFGLRPEVTPELRALVERELLGK